VEAIESATEELHGMALQALDFAILMDMLVQAGRVGRPIWIEDIGWDAQGRQFVDLEGTPIGTLSSSIPGSG
jgi:glutathionylspermidine synthase